MISLSMLIFVLVLNSCDVNSKSEIEAPLILNFCNVDSKSETEALLIPEMVFVKGGIIEGKDYPWAPPKGNFPKGRRVQLSDFAIGKYEVTQE